MLLVLLDVLLVALLLFVSGVPLTSVGVLFVVTVVLRDTESSVRVFAVSFVLLQPHSANESAAAATSGILCILFMRSSESSHC